MRRLAVLVIALVALTACGSSTPHSAPSPSATSELTPSTSPTVSTSPTPTGDTTIEGFTLLPPECTADDHVRVVHRSSDGGGGEYYDWWALKADHPCTLDGTPHVQLLRDDGSPADLRYVARWPHGKTVPAVAGPHRTATVAIMKFRCDGPNPPTVHTARITLPDGIGTLTATMALPYPYCPGDGSQVVHIAPIGLWNAKKPTKPYAVNLRSAFDPGNASMWGSTDLDGDGLPDTVLLRTSHRAHTMLDVEFGDGKGSENELGFPPARLQALTDLNGDGLPEILVATTAEGAGSGYQFGSMATYVMQLTPATPSEPVAVVMAAKPNWQLSFSNAGRGDLWAGVQCHGKDLTQTTAVLAGGPFKPRGTNTYDVTRTTWRVEDGKATKLSTRKSEDVPLASHPVDDVWTPVADDCPGMTGLGWAS